MTTYVSVNFRWLSPTQRSLERSADKTLSSKAILSAFQSQPTESEVSPSSNSNKLRTWTWINASTTVAIKMTGAIGMRTMMFGSQEQLLTWPRHSTQGTIQITFTDKTLPSPRWETRCWTTIQLICSRWQWGISWTTQWAVDLEACKM